MHSNSVDRQTVGFKAQSTARASPPKENQHSQYVHLIWLSCFPTHSAALQSQTAHRVTVNLYKPRLNYVVVFFFFFFFLLTTYDLSRLRLCHTQNRRESSQNQIQIQRIHFCFIHTIVRSYSANTIKVDSRDNRASLKKTLKNRSVHQNQFPCCSTRRACVVHFVHMSWKGQSPMSPMSSLQFICNISLFVTETTPSNGIRSHLLITA